MRKVHMFEAKSGDVLGVDIYGPNGTVLLAKGVKLTDSYIRGLRENGIRHIYIHDIFTDRKSTRLNSSHSAKSRMPSSA